MNSKNNYYSARNKVLGPYTRRIAEAIGGRIVPDGGTIPYAFTDTEAVDFLEQYLLDMDTPPIAVKALLVAFDLLPPLFIFKPSRFVNLSAEDQDRFLEDWQESRIYYRRMVMVLLKTLTTMGFYNDPQVLESMGYYEKCVKEDRP